MVASTQIFSRLIASLKKDFSQFVDQIIHEGIAKPGLYPYRKEFNGNLVHLHLRIQENGYGLLFVNVNDVIHLNPTATKMTKFALDEVPLDHARAILSRQVIREQQKHLDSDLNPIYDMIQRLSYPDTSCPTCEISPHTRAPLFSINPNAPYKADLALTYGCNNQCSHCYNEPDRFNLPSLPELDWYHVIDRLAQVGIPHIIFTGGEATLHPDLPKLVNYASELGLVTGLNTNGRRIAYLPYMETLAQSGLDHVQVTLGSHIPNVHNAMMGANSFNQTVKGIQNALATNIHCITNTTLMRCNADYIEDTIDFLYELGLRTFAMNGMIYSGGGCNDPNAIAEEDLAPLLIGVRDHAAEKGMRFLWYTPTEYCRMSPVELELGAKRCNAGEYSICIEPNGDVLPCQSYYVAAGNILTDGWSQIWQSDLFRNFRDRNLYPITSGLPAKCWDCPDLPLCGGGCRIAREARGKSRPDENEGLPNSSCSSGCGITDVNQSTSNNSSYIPIINNSLPFQRSTGLSHRLEPR